MSTTQTPDRFTTLPDEQTLAATVVALEEHGFSVEVVDDLDAARDAVLARIPEGSSVMTNTSVTLQETGIADAIDAAGPYESARRSSSPTLKRHASGSTSTACRSRTPAPTPPTDRTASSARSSRSTRKHPAASTWCSSDRWSGSDPHAFAAAAAVRRPQAKTAAHQQ